jgi:nucleotide-binding universal stress UspA family protein
VYQNILVPTDGSALSRKAIRNAVRLAKEQEIVRAAGRRKCDLVYMASHGRRGISRLILGSEASKVLALSKVPVLVER